ncbi:ABC transporter substrate-binding protein [Humibacillus xanthopallidus]|uniref:ABC transporter substrate-binding protein n=1 Tax=Humibacillus xanthopallidus TaxID=412689 RepID=UPI00384C3A86
MSDQNTTIGRRRFLHGLGAVGIGGALSACVGPTITSRGSGSASGGADAQVLPAVNGSPATGKVSFAHWRAEDKEVFDKLIESFVKANPQASVEQDIAPSNDYQSTALQKVKGGTIGTAFVAFRGAQFTNMNKAGLYAGLGAQPFVDGYFAELIKAGQAPSRAQMGLPYQLVFNMPIFNEDAFEAAGVSSLPTDWDGFLALCETLKAKGLTPIAWPGGEPANSGQLINSMVMNNMPTDTAFADIEAGTRKVTDDWFLETLKQYQQLAPFFEANSTGTSSEPLQQLFASGKAGMLATGSFHISAVRKLGAEFPIGLIAPITVAADKAKYEGIYNATFILGVNSAGTGQDAALKWVEFLSDPVNAAVYANGTSQHVTVKNVDYTNADLKHNAPWLAKKTLLAPRFQFNNLDIRAAVEASCVAVVGGTSPDQAAEQAQVIIDQRK